MVSLVNVVTLVTNIATEFPVTFFAFVKFISLTFLLTPFSRVLLQKLTGSQLVKKFPACYGTRRFITAFTTVLYLFLS